MRRLLVLTILFAVPMPALAQPAPLAQDDAAIVAIQHLGGTTYQDEHAPGRPVISVRFYKAIHDEDLDLIRGFPDLVSLTIYQGIITDVGLARLASLTQLASLSLDQSQVSGEGLTHLAKLPKLQKLDLHDCPVNDANLQALEGMSQLRELALGGTNVTENAVARLKIALPYALIDRVGGSDGSAGKNSQSVNWSLPACVVVVGGLIAGFLVCRRWQLLSKRAWVWKLAVVLGMVIVAEFALLRWAPDMAPVKDGDPATFWLHACEIDVGVKHPRRGFAGFYQPRDGWSIYYVQGMHGRFLYRVKEQDAAALFPTVVAKLEHAPPGALVPDVEAGVREWLSSDPDRADIHFLLAKLREALLNRLHEENARSYQYVLAEEEDFGERWERVKRYHWNVVSEALFFAGLIVFAAWPWLRGGGYLRWAVHLGLVPPLFFLPFWLGYARLSFTSAGPIGGALYPVLIARFRGFLSWTALDTMIVRNFPQVLEPLSQASGPMLSLSGGRAVGPVATVVMSGGILLIIAAIKIFISRKSDFLPLLRTALARLRSSRVADKE